MWPSEFIVIMYFLFIDVWIAIILGFASLFSKITWMERKWNRNFSLDG